MEQIVVWEDLGIAQAEFERQIESAKLNREVVWEKEKASPEKVDILINVKQKITADIINQYPNLKMIAVAFTGFDSVDLAACKEKGIAVYNVPAYSTASVAELAVGLTISLLREIPKSDEIIRNGEWNLKPGLDLAGRTVGILGTGTIGLHTARIFKAFGCELIGWSRSEKQAFKDLGGKYMADKKEFFASADIVSIHLPYNKHTAHLVGKEELGAMKKSAFLINTARGPIVDEAALISVLKNQKIAGAGLDVYSEEPIHRDNELLKMKNTVLTPHIAYKTEEALNRRAQTTVQNIVEFLKGKTTNRVN